MTCVYRLTASLLGLATLAACGAGTPRHPVSVEESAAFSPPEPLPASGAFFLPGESMTFELSLRGVAGGVAHVAVGEPGELEGRNVIIIRSRTESTGVAAVFKEVRDEVISWVDVGSGLPVYHHADVKFGNKEAVLETHFDQGKAGSFLVHYDRKGVGPKKLRHTMPSQGVFDGHSIIGALRGWDAEEEDLAFFYVLASRRVWRNTVRFTAREKVETSLGRYPAIRIDGSAVRLTRTLGEDKGKKPRHFTIWISDDDDRLPLLVVAKTEYGDLRVELTEYRRPELPALSRR